ncbi:MAG: hypothetical protein RBU37_03620 [Myxococcota bacterium]|jgi:hypothetical protein|nr:hypothetical protein [Myxococcota bacterium]
MSQGQPVLGESAVSPESRGAFRGLRCLFASQRVFVSWLLFVPLFVSLLSGCAPQQESVASRRSAAEQRGLLEEALGRARAEEHWLRAVALLELLRRVDPENAELGVELQQAREALSCQRSLDEVRQLLTAGAYRAALARLLVLSTEPARAASASTAALLSPSCAEHPRFEALRDAARQGLGLAAEAPVQPGSPVELGRDGAAESPP